MLLWVSRCRLSLSGLENSRMQPECPRNGHFSLLDKSWMSIWRPKRSLRLKLDPQCWEQINYNNVIIFHTAVKKLSVEKQPLIWKENYSIIVLLTGQIKGVSSLCISLWLARYCSVLKALPQSSQANLAEDAWVLRCRLRNLSIKKLFPQWGQA